MRLFGSKRTTVPVVRLVGTIGAGSSLRPGLSLKAVEGALEKAFRVKGPAVALVVNSPGGSPVQSSLIYARIRELAAEKDKTVLAFVEDVAASGGYWLANAGDEIFCDESSVVGSIGVITAAFGFTGLIAKLGVERRVYTTGENKSVLDPFQPEKERDVEILKAVQRDIQSAFEAAIRARRGDRLADDPDLFSGRFWAGASAVSLGLADGIGRLQPVLKERYGEKVRLRPVEIQRPSLLRARLGAAVEERPAGLAALSPDAWIAAVRADRQWERFGL